MYTHIKLSFLHTQAAVRGVMDTNGEIECQVKCLPGQSQAVRQRVKISQLLFNNRKAEDLCNSVFEIQMKSLLVKQISAEGSYNEC